MVVVLLVVVGLVVVGEGVEGAVGGEGVFWDALPGLIGFFFAGEDDEFEDGLFGVVACGEEKRFHVG